MWTRGVAPPYHPQNGPCRQGVGRSVPVVVEHEEAGCHHVFSHYTFNCLPAASQLAPLRHRSAGVRSSGSGPLPVEPTTGITGSARVVARLSALRHLPTSWCVFPRCHACTPLLTELTAVERHRISRLSDVPGLVLVRPSPQILEVYLQRILPHLVVPGRSQAQEPLHPPDEVGHLVVRCQTPLAQPLLVSRQLSAQVCPHLQSSQ